MELKVDISAMEQERLHISSDRLTIDELKRKILLAEMDESFQKSQDAAKMYGIDNWSMNDINSMIKEAKAAYHDKNSD